MVYSTQLMSTLNRCLQCVASVEVILKVTVLTYMNKVISIVFRSPSHRFHFVAYKWGVPTAVQSVAYQPVSPFACRLSLVSCLLFQTTNWTVTSRSNLWS
jgi:hypothetical protein